MTDPDEALSELCRGLIAAIEQAAVGTDELDATLAAIERVAAAYGPEERADVLATLSYDFGRRALRDTVAMRTAVFSAACWRIRRLTDPQSAFHSGLVLANHQAGLDDTSTALDLIAAIQAACAPIVDAALERMALAMTLKYLLRLHRSGDAHALASKSEAADAARASNAVELSILISGAKAANLAHDYRAAHRRAVMAVERCAGGAYLVQGEPGLATLIASRAMAAEAHIEWGNSLRNTADPMGAIDAYQRGRREALREGDAMGAAFCQSEIGITWELLGESLRSTQALEQAAQEAERIGAPRHAARWRHRGHESEDAALDVSGFNGVSVVAQAFNAGKITPEHTEIVKAIIREGKSQGSRLEPVARNLLAAIYAREEKFGLALSAIEASAVAAQQLGDKWLSLLIQSNRARLLYQAGHRNECYRTALAVLADAGQMWETASSSEVRQAASSAAAGAAEAALLLLSTSSVPVEVTGFPDLGQAALHVVHATRAKSFNRWLHLLNWSRGLGHGALHAAARELIAVEVEIEWAAFDGHSLRDLIAKKEATAHHFAALAADAGLPYEAAAAPHQPHVPPGAIVLDLGAIESGIVCLCATADAAPRILHIDWTREQRGQWQGAFSEALQAVADALARSDRVGSAIEDDPMLAMYGELERDFVHPLLEWLGSGIAHLVVSLHAELAFIPVWALARSIPGIALSVVPSLQSIGLLASRPPSTAERAMMIGDATASLPMVAQEAALMPQYQQVSPTVATLQTAARLSRRLHFAGHGEFCAHNPYESGLILKGEASPPYMFAAGRRACVRLAIPGILRLIDAGSCELVTLSACSVGAPRSHAASEFTSVPTALLLAGAHNVVAPIWQVHDASTALLMFYFNDELKTCPGIARSLATARERLAASTRQTCEELLGAGAMLPPGPLPFSSPIFTDASVHFGVA